MAQITASHGRRREFFSFLSPSVFCFSFCLFRPLPPFLLSTYLSSTLKSVRKPFGKRQRTPRNVRKLPARSVRNSDLCAVNENGKMFFFPGRKRNIWLLGGTNEIRGARTNQSNMKCSRRWLYGPEYKNLGTLKQVEPIRNVRDNDDK